MFCPSFLRFEHLTSSRSITISRLAYTLLNRVKLGQKLGGGQKLLGRNDSTHATQPSRDST